LSTRVSALDRPASYAASTVPTVAIASAMQPVRKPTLDAIGVPHSAARRDCGRPDDDGEMAQEVTTGSSAKGRSAGSAEGPGGRR